MKLTDYFKYSYILFKKDKKRSLLSVIICFLLSILTMGCMYIGFTYYNNMMNIENKYLHEKPLMISVSNNNSLMIEYGKKYNASRIIAESNFALYIDFEKEDDFIITGGVLPSSSHELLVKEKTNLKIGDIVKYNDIEYIVSGTYESSDFDKYIGNINYLPFDLKIKNVVLIYSEAATGTYKNIKKLFSQLDSLNIFVDHYDYDMFLSYHKYGTYIVVFSILVSVILFISSIGFFANSLIMSLNQSKKLLAMLNLNGLSRNKLIVVESMYGFTLSFVGMILAYISVWIISLFINLNKLYFFLIPSQFKSILYNYKYLSNFPWYIVFINLFLFVISILLICFNNSKKIVNSKGIFTKDF